MPIQIIDGFQVNTASPIDSRIVASGSAARNAIPYKYEGLRVFDTSDSVPYVYINNNWQSENASGISGAGTVDYIPRYTSSGVIGNSLLYQTGSPTFLVKTVNTGSGADRVIINASTGLVTAQSFSGDGSQITNINATNIASGNLSLNRLTNGSTGWILSGASGQPAYVNPNQITVGTSSVATQSTVTNTTSNTNNYVTFVSNTSGNNQIRVNSTGLLYNPATNVLTTGTVSANGIKFPSTQIPSTDVNTLDDYEEGTWTPGISGLVFPAPFTFTSAGWYTKIGRVIHISGYIKFTSLPMTCPSPPADYYVDLSGAPFSVSNASPSVAVGVWTINNSTGTPVINRIYSSADSGHLIISNQVTGNSRMYFHGSGGNPLDPCVYYTLGKVISFSITIQHPLVSF